VAPYEA